MTGVVAEGVGETGDVRLLPTCFGGHCYYVRKCMTGEAVSDREFWRRHLNGIELPDSVADRSLIVEVVGVGPRVGTRCTRKHSAMFHRARHIGDNAGVGDFLLCPNDDPGIKQSPLAPWEFFIEEGTPLLICPAEELKSMGG